MSRFLFILSLILTHLNVSSILWASASVDVSDAEARISYLEDQVQMLTGKVEELNHALKKTEGHNEEAEASENVLAGDAPKLSAQDDDQLTILTSDIDQDHDLAVQPAQTLPIDDIQGEYDQAMSQLKQEAPQQAGQAFKDFIARHQNKKQGTAQRLVINAHYWLGECLLAQNNLNEAAQQFAACYQNYAQSRTKPSHAKSTPQGASKAPEALAKLAATFQRMKKPQEACATLGQLNQEFKQLSSSVKKMSERISHECKCPVER